MMESFYRAYRLTVGLGDMAVTIEPPITVSFKALESVSQKSLGKLSVSINGLKPSTRLQLVKAEDDDKYIPVKLEVGYNGKLRQIFQGSVRRGEVKRDGPIHAVSLECEDGGHDFINAYTTRTVKGRDQVVDAILQDMPNTKKGSVTQQSGIIRPKVLVGSSSKILNDSLAPGENFFIKDERVNILKSNEVTSSEIPVINAKSGLMNTPQFTSGGGGEKAKGEITFDTKLNPMLRIGGLCSVESATNPALNGVYKVYQVETNGQYTGSAWHQKVICQPVGNYKVIK